MRENSKCNNTIRVTLPSNHDITHQRRTYYDSSKIFTLSIHSVFSVNEYHLSKEYKTSNNKTRIWPVKATNMH